MLTFVIIFLLSMVALALTFLCISKTEVYKQTLKKVIEEDKKKKNNLNNHYSSSSDDCSGGGCE